MDRQPLPVHESSQPLPPPFIPSRFIDNSTFRLYYAFGNTPAEDLLEHVPDSIDTPSVLQLGCGDMRSCLYTLWKNFDKQYGHGNFKGVLFHQNDYCAAILARNVLFIHLILKLGNLIGKRADVLEIKQMVSSIWNIWFCHDLYHAQFVLLKDSLNELSEFFSDEKSWCKPSNQLKSLLEFSINNGTMKAIRSMFKMWLRMFDFSAKKKAKIKGAKKDISLDYLNTFKILGFYRMAEKERLHERIGELQKECNSYLKSGNAFAEASFKLANNGDLFLNPTLYERDDQYSLHYTSIPYTCFAQYVPYDHKGFTPLVAKYRGMPLLDNKKANNTSLLGFSLQQFSLWLMSASETLFEAISTQKHSIKFVFNHSDALMASVQLSHTHKHAFDVIHTSNLIDHLSPLAVVVSTIPLLKKEGILLTTTIIFGNHGLTSGYDFVANSMGFELDKLLIFGIRCIGHEGDYAGDGVLVPVPSYLQAFETPEFLMPQTLLWKRLNSTTPLCLINLEGNALITEILYKCIQNTTFSFQQNNIAFSSIGSCSHTGIRALCLFLNQLSLQSPVGDSKFWEGLSNMIRANKMFRPFLMHLQCQALVMNLHMHLIVTKSDCPICSASLSTSLKKYSLKFTPDNAFERASNINSVVLICLHPSAIDPSSLNLSNPALLNPDVFLFDSSPCSVLDKNIMTDLIVLESAFRVPISSYNGTLIFQHYDSSIRAFNTYIKSTIHVVPPENSTALGLKLEDKAKVQHTLLQPNPSSKLGQLTLLEYTRGCFKVNIALSDDSISVLDKHSLTTELVSNTEFKLVAKSLSFPIQFSLPVDYSKVSVQLSKKRQLVMIDAPCKMFDTYSPDQISLFYSNPAILSELDVSHDMLELSAKSQFTFKEMKILEKLGKDSSNVTPTINMKKMFSALFQHPKKSLFRLVKITDINGAKFGLIIIHKRLFDVQNQTVALELSYYIDKNGVREDTDPVYLSWEKMRLNSGIDKNDADILINGNEISLIKDTLAQFHHRTRSKNNNSEYPLKGYGLEDYFRRAVVYYPSSTYNFTALLPTLHPLMFSQHVLAKDMCSLCKMHLEPRDVLKCSKCLVAIYCGRSCQVKHWATHKIICQEIQRGNASVKQPSNISDQSTPMNNVTEKCSFCKTESSDLRKCSRCKSVAYCSKACQTNHWNEHKKHCKAATAKPK